MMFQPTSKQTTHLKASTKGLGGFTLIEVLVALTVMGIVFAGLVQIGGVSSKVGKTVSDRVGQSWQAEGLAAQYVASLRNGQYRAPPAGITARFSVSDTVAGDERVRLNATGWELYSLLISSSAGQIWQGEILLRADTEIGGS